MIDKSRLGPFVLEQRLGRQRNGTVYHAVHIERRRAMAVRLMSQHVGHSGIGVPEFAREVDFLKTLEHPNVVRVFGGGVFDDEAYIAMELVKGESLDEVLARGGGLPWQTVVDYVTQACAGLEYAHQRGTVHQNLSTAKLLLTEQGQIKITDFRGNRLNQFDRWEAQPHVTAVAYMAPEQLRGDRNVSQKADLYALGCVMFEMLTGHLPFAARTAVELREKHLHEPVPHVSAEVFDCPVWLDTLVAQLMEKDPNKRPHFASSVSVALQEVKQNVTTGIVEHAVSNPVSALSHPAADTSVKRLLKRKTTARKEWVPFYERVWFLGACAAVIIALCTWAFWPASEEELFAKAEALMASGERTDWTKARDDYLKPLLDKYPDGKFSSQVREYLDQIELKTAQAKMETNLRWGRRAATEAERRYAEAWQLEQDGDLPAALAAYDELIEKVEPEKDDLPFMRLAQQHIDKLKPAVALANAAQKQEPQPSGGEPAEPPQPSSIPVQAPAPETIPASALPVRSPPQ